MKSNRSIIDIKSNGVCPFDVDELDTIVPNGQFLEAYKNISENTIVIPRPDLILDGYAIIVQPKSK